MPQYIPVPHPGETILEDFAKPLEMSLNQLAKALHMRPSRLHEIVHGRRGISADTALRLARYFGVSAQFFLGLQLEYDLRTAERTNLKTIEREIKPRAAA